MAGGKKAPGPKTKEGNITNFLIKKFGKVYYQSKDAQRDEVIEKMITDARHNNVLFTAEEIRNRFGNLRKRFVLDRNKGANSWCHFQAMQEIFKDESAKPLKNKIFKNQSAKTNKRSRATSELVEEESGARNEQGTKRTRKIKQELVDKNVVVEIDYEQEPPPIPAHMIETTSGLANNLALQNSFEAEAIDLSVNSPAAPHDTNAQGK